MCLYNIQNRSTLNEAMLDKLCYTSYHTAIELTERDSITEQRTFIYCDKIALSNNYDAFLVSTVHNTWQ